MMTRQHLAISLMAHMSKKGNLDSFRKEIPWIVFEDAIRCFIPERQAGHFELTPDTTDTAWMIMPSESTVLLLTKENAKQLIRYYVPIGAYPKCVIGEETQIKTFDTKNYGHKHYHSLRMHLWQDIVLDNTLRNELILVHNRFKDEFTLRCDVSKNIDGATLRSQVALFEEYGFLHLAGKVYERTGILMNQKWFDDVVKVALSVNYPRDMVENTYKYMKLSAEMDNRISSKKFEIHSSEKAKLFMVPNLEEVLDKMYAEAYYYTAREL